MFQGVSIRAAVFSVFPEETRAICTFLLAQGLDAQPPGDVPDKPPHVLIIAIDGPTPQETPAAARGFRLLFSGTPTLALAREATPEAFARAMACGAQRDLAFPLDPATLLPTLHDLLAQSPPPPEALAACHSGRAITIFSPNGGSGATSLAINLVLALRLRRHRTILVDANLAFGCHDVLLDLQSSHTILDLATNPDDIDPDLLEHALTAQGSGLRCLLAPTMPEESDRLTARHLQALIAHVRSLADYSLIDTYTALDDRTLALIEAADTVLVPFGPELTAVKNMHAFLRVISLLKYDAAKIVPILTRADTLGPGHANDVTRSLNWPVPTHNLISDGRRATTSGKPYYARDRTCLLSQQIDQIADALIAAAPAPLPPPDPADRRPPLLRRFRL